MVTCTHLMCIGLHLDVLLRFIIIRLLLTTSRHLCFFRRNKKQPAAWSLHIYISPKAPLNISCTHHHTSDVMNLDACISHNILKNIPWLARKYTSIRRSFLLLTSSADLFLPRESLPNFGVNTFTREYSKVSISTGNAKWTSNESRSSKDRKSKCFVGRELASPKAF